MARSSTGQELTAVDGAIGAAVAEGDADGHVGFYLAVDEARAVGRALHWGRSRGMARMEILAEGGASALARRAALLSDEPAPSIGVWSVEGAEVTKAVASPAAEPPTIPDEHWALAGVISEAGAHPVDDRGTLIAEFAGLEVARVTDTEVGPALDVGVGQADRELNQLVHRESDPGESLRRVIAAVAGYRRPGSHHPLTRVGRERWLRSLLIEKPALVGAASLEPLVPLRVRGGLRETEPSAAAGTLPSGRPVVVVTAVGVDLDLIPEAADYLQYFNPEAELVCALPERDLKLSVGPLDRLSDARAVGLNPPWQ